MENSIQERIKHLSDEVKKLARDILKEKASVENIQRNAELGFESYDEDDFTNLINGYQYTIEELESACAHLYEASAQYKFVLNDTITINSKYVEYL